MECMRDGRLSRAVFLDRDGVINEVVFRNGKPCSPRTVEEFRLCEGITEALHRLASAGLHLFVVSNQPDVARGFLSSLVLREMNDRILAFLPVERVLACPHDDADDCPCRKPKPGMLYELASSEAIDLPRSFLIGDSWKDVQAGERAGCKTILLRRPYNTGVGAHIVIESLLQAVDLILGELTHADTDAFLRR